MSAIRTQPGPPATGGLPGPPPDDDRGVDPGLDKERRNPLGSYLRARRELITPERAGLSVAGARRVPGLRLEELAMLAGISADYYLRLERGRDRNPSAQVLEALARALHLDHDHVTHLRALALTPARPPARRREVPVPASALQLIHALDRPAFIENAYFDVLAANSAALDLNPRLTPGRNQLRDLFLDDDEQAMHPDWELAAACLTAGLRHTMGRDTDDPRYFELTNELSQTSSAFRRLWARHDVRAQRGAAVRLTHPRDGTVTLNREQLSINETDHVKLVVYYPRADTASP